MKVFLGLTLLVFLASCQSGINKENLQGQWNYVSYEYSNKSLDKPLSNIASQKPFIVFDRNGDCRIVSSGKEISSGKYHLENKIIRYEEVLPGGRKRAIPFLIQSLSDNKLVFQTMDAEVKVITAIKNEK